MQGWNLLATWPQDERPVLEGQRREVDRVGEIIDVDANFDHEATTGDEAQALVEGDHHRQRFGVAQAEGRAFVGPLDLEREVGAWRRDHRLEARVHPRRSVLDEVVRRGHAWGPGELGPVDGHRAHVAHQAEVREAEAHRLHDDAVVDHRWQRRLRSPREHDAGDVAAAINAAIDDDTVVLGVVAGGTSRQGE